MLVSIPIHWPFCSLHWLLLNINLAGFPLAPPFKFKIALKWRISTIFTLTLPFCNLTTLANKIEKKIVKIYSLIFIK